MLALRFIIAIIISLLLSTHLQSQKFIPRIDGFHGMYLKKDPTGKTNYPMVMGVAKDSPADKANMKTGYLITEIDGTKTDLNSASMQRVDKLLAGYEGKVVILTLLDIYVQDKIIKLELTLGAKPTTNQLIYDPPELSQYFPIRLKNCIGSLETNSDELKGEFISMDSEEYNKYYIKSCFLNDSQTGTYREKKTDQRTTKVTFHKLADDLQDRDLANTFLKELVHSAEQTLTEIAPFIKTEEIQEESNDDLVWNDSFARFKYKQTNAEYQIILALVGDEYGRWDIDAVIIFSVLKEQVSVERSEPSPTYQKPRTWANLRPVMSYIYDIHFNNEINTDEVKYDYHGRVPMPEGGNDLTYTFDVIKNTDVVVYVLTNAECAPYILIYEANTTRSLMSLNGEDEIKTNRDGVLILRDAFKTHSYSKYKTTVEITFGYSSSCPESEIEKADMELMIFTLN